MDDGCGRRERAGLLINSLINQNACDRADLSEMRGKLAGGCGNETIPQMALPLWVRFVGQKVKDCESGIS